MVFVRNRNNGVKWLPCYALIFGFLMRMWSSESAESAGDIEVFFKMAKNYHKLDSIVAHSSIVMIRYIFLAVEQRFASDDRTIGSLFLATSDEIRDLSVTGALVRIISVVCNKVRSFYSTSKRLMLEIIEATMKEALALIRPGFNAKCES